jgi:hypothetical protein
MDTKSLLQDARAESLTEVLGFQSKTGKTKFFQTLEKPLEARIDHLRDKQKTILAYRNLSSKVHSQHEHLFQRLAEIEPALQTLLEPKALEKESMEQVLFSKYIHTQLLNTIPYLLAFVSLWKQYLVPALAVCMPLFFFFLPYLTMKWVYRLPIKFREYIHIFCITLGIPSDPSKLDIRQSVQMLFTCISLGQSIYQPIQTSYHIQTIDKDILEKADALLELQTMFETMFPEKHYIFEGFDWTDKRRSFAAAWDLPYRISVALSFLGEYEVIHRLALMRQLHIVEFNESRHVEMKELLDPLLTNSNPLSFFFTKTKHHSVLTGPNGGGKSTALRCILLNLIFAQRFGLYFGTESSFCKLHPFDWIQSGLHLEDSPGKYSLFEREVQFAASALKYNRLNPEKRGLLLFDELFHSTNPPDGERTATLFLQQVWDSSSLSSIISTHVFSLAESSPSFVQRLCVPAEKLPTGDLHFTYTLQPGICRVSSVDIVLKKRGFFPPGKPANEKE